MKSIESASASSQNENQRKKSVIIDIPHKLEPILWLDQCCIYKVPWNLRKINQGAYTPQLISIGPLHHGNKKLAEMETQKLIYLSEFCKQTKKTWNDFVSIIEKDCKEEDIRHCYAEKSKLCSHEYVKMILLDAVFIIELFRRNFDMEKKEEKKIKEEKEKDDYMFKKQWLKNGIQQDLLLLENQLPYFVLKELFKSAFPDKYQPTFQKSSEERYTFHHLTCEYFKDYTPGTNINTFDQEKLHFTDLLRYFMSKTQPKKKSSIKNQCSATKLHEAGVKFEFKKKGNDARLTEIVFDEAELICCKGAKLTMTQFEVNDNTERVMRNLMALEQCHYPFDADICNYICLMDYLIDTTKDVDLLVENGVIVNSIGSNEAVARLVNKLCINIGDSNFCYHKICEGLNKHCKKSRYRSLKLLRSVYFANIWRGTGTVAAIVLLVLTLLQTISSFL